MILGDIDSPLFPVLLCIGVFAQLWASMVVFKDQRFDVLTRMGYLLLVNLLPGLGFFLVNRLRHNAIASREEVMRRSRARLGGSLRRRW